MPEELSNPSPQAVATIHALFENLPDNFHERQERLQGIRKVFYEEVAQATQTPLNEYIAQLPQDTLDEKLKVASHVNGLLRSLGLTVRDPKTGRSALLVADFKNAQHPDVSRYRFEVRDELGKPSRTFSTQGALPELTLMQEFHRKDFWAKRERDHGPVRR